MTADHCADTRTDHRAEGGSHPTCDPRTREGVVEQQQVLEIQGRVSVVARGRTCAVAAVSGWWDERDALSVRDRTPEPALCNSHFLHQTALQQIQGRPVLHMYGVYPVLLCSPTNIKRFRSEALVTSKCIRNVPKSGCHEFTDSVNKNVLSQHKRGCMSSSFSN